VVKTIYRCVQEDGTTCLRTTFTCPFCMAEEEDRVRLSAHAKSVHGYILPCSDEAAIVIPEQPEDTAVVITKLLLPDGDCQLLCPMCDARFPGDGQEELLQHAAVLHGKVWASADGKVKGDSDRLDYLHQAMEEHWYPRRAEALQKLHVVSLGSYCGVKFSIQRLGLGEAHLPFDWIRTTSKGVQHFLSSGFADFFTVASQHNVPSAGMKVLRSEIHSFWHDDVSDHDSREKLQRRIDRLQCLKDDTKDILFVRSTVTTDEVAEVENLYRVLQEQFSGSGRRVLLVMAIGGQDSFEGPIFHDVLPGVVFYLQPTADHEKMMEGEAFCMTVGAAVDEAMKAETASPLLGFAREPCTLRAKSVASGAALLNRLRGCDAGLHSGYDDLTCFEPPHAPHFDLRFCDGAMLRGS